MASNSGLKHWSQSDIEFLKAELKKGSRVKHIASCLNRSQTAVSKFAARHGLQTRRYTRGYKKFEGIPDAQYSATIKRKPIKYIKVPPILPKAYDFTSFDLILKYLIAKKHRISSKIPDNIKLFYPDSKYLLDGKPVTKIRLLLLANKYRLEEGKDPFKTYESLW